MLTLVGRARRRLFRNQLFSQAANAAIAVLIFLILLLLVGTSFLDGRWTLLVIVLASAFALYRARKLLPSLYDAARIVDQRLALADTISTAIHFRQQASNQSSPEIRQVQQERAARVSESVDVRQAVPYTMPRNFYLAMVLLLAAGSICALRYGLLGSLDLQPPLAHMLQQQFGWKERSDVARNARGKQPSLKPGAQDDKGDSPDDPDKSLKPDTSSSDGSEAGNADPQQGEAAKGDGKKEGNRAGKGGEGEQQAQAESNPSDAADKSGQEGNKQDQKQQSQGKPEGNNGQSSSLMDKAKDLLENLLSSVKPPPNNGGNQQKNGDPGNQPGKGQPKQQDDKKGQQQSGQPGDSPDGKQGEQGQNQDQQENANGKNESQQSTKKPGSGAGNQDGDKRIKQAEDLAAMGKITEILGKRSTTVTGEATVEVQSTAQQLHTPYAQRAAQHGQSGGEINRDEVPVAMQPYVQQYFEQVRKQAQPAPAPKK